MSVLHKRRHKHYHAFFSPNLCRFTLVSGRWSFPYVPVNKMIHTLYPLPDYSPQIKWYTLFVSTPAGLLRSVMTLPCPFPNMNKVEMISCMNNDLCSDITDIYLFLDIFWKFFLSAQTTNLFLTLAFPLHICLAHDIDQRAANWLIVRKWDVDKTHQPSQVTVAVPFQFREIFMKVNRCMNEKYDS